ncbi:MAG: hypothetical protein ACR2JY_22565 [Chloroflexota bacterium]
MLAGCGAQVRVQATVTPGTQTASPYFLPLTVPPPAPSAPATPTVTPPTMTSTPGVTLTSTSAPSQTPAATIQPAISSAASTQVPAQDDAVWAAVVRGIGQTIAPLLKPTVLPVGMTTVQLLSVHPGAFRVVYQGSGKRLEVSVGQLNPPPGAGQVVLSVGGQRVALVLHLPDSPDGSDWLTWREPGRWVPFGMTTAEPFIEYFIFAIGISPAVVQQVLAGLALVPLPAPSASPTNGNTSFVPSLSTKIGGISVGISGATVLRVSGEPAVRTVSHGLGTPEWHYTNGLTVELTDPTNPANPDAVWGIMVRSPFGGATATGFRLGDTKAQCRKRYEGLAITEPQMRQLQIEAADGTLLGVLFDPSGKAIMITFISNQVVCPNCGPGTRIV